jgi:hypothetical protein
MWLLTLQLFKNNIDTQGKLHNLSVNLHNLSVNELLEYRRKTSWGRLFKGGLALILG